MYVLNLNFYRLSTVSAFRHKHKKIVNFILFVLEVLDYLISK